MFNKIKVVEKVTTEKRKNMDVLILKYEHLQGSFTGQQWTTTALAIRLSKEARTLLERSKPGDILWMEQEQQEKTTPDGTTKRYYSIGDVRTDFENNEVNTNG